ncbi:MULTISPECIES: transcriptional regulator [Brevibacillus]|uniref:transcriptional regulator n=1 Tax=Brevibacillus TaxID=55080 RepID=UPI000D0F3CEE|nr:MULTISPECIES: transcriptional regulator [Brevibacillus]MED1946438.1 helix-turn-helix domain-containing protein [Brevibacillus formosus]MED1996696.1 helix-turn-helix domain-containing protein [Brevibacillus formosus]MED2084613.1 helix-turn-helix domain-containing protein [Brevibacillus formosus]PSK11704.1 transcriptional regulator [Brevibacillus sp. NRRL NRS-603]
MKRYVVVETLDQLKAVSDSLRLQIITMLVKEEYTGKQLATLLSLSPSKVHYHLKELENHGFVEVVRTEEKNGIVQKFYRAVAYDFKVSEDLLPSLREDSILLQETMLNHLRSSMNRLYNAPDESFMLFSDQEDRPPAIAVNSEVKAPRKEIVAWLNKYKALLEELSEMEDRYLERIAAGEAEDTVENFYMVTVGFMTNVRYYVAEDDSLPDNYEHQKSEFKHFTGKIVVKKKKGEDGDEHAGDK